VDVDPKSWANVQDPFPLYAWLRERHPLHWSASLNAWVVTRWGDVLEVFNQPRRFSADRFRKVDERYASRRSAVRAVADVLGHWLVFRDPPDHDRLRGLLQSSFTPKQLASSRDRIQRTVETLLDRVVARGAMDFIRDLAFPLPAMVICGLMGVPDDDLEAIKGWSDRLAAYLGGAVDERDNFTEASAGVAALVDYFGMLLRERERRPLDDLMSLLLRAEHEGSRLTHDEVVANCILLLFAGHETTTNLIGNGLHLLLTHPDSLQRLRAEPQLIASAVEECLRFESSNQLGNRLVIERTVMRDVVLDPGTYLTLCIGAANRDPEEFADPDRFDIGRQPNRHLAFAAGAHACAGMAVARLEGRVAIARAVQRFPKLQLSGVPVRGRRARFRGFTSIPARVD